MTKAKFIFTSVLIFVSFMGSSQESYSTCVELLRNKSKILIAKEYPLNQENKLVEDLINCADFTISKKELIDILGEPNQVKNYFSGTENCNFTLFIYFLKPSYKAKSFIGQTLQFPFKENTTNCLKIKKARFCE